MCGPLFEEELAFWGIDEKQIEPCCWPTYRAHRDAQETLAEFDSDHSDDSGDEEDEEEIARRFGIVEQAREEKQGFARWQPRVWHLLEDPNSSPAARVSAVLSFVRRLVGLVGKVSASRAEDTRVRIPLALGFFSGLSHTSDFKIGTPVATLPGAWRYRVSAGTGRPGVSIL